MVDRGPLSEHGCFANEICGARERLERDGRADEIPVGGGGDEEAHGKNDDAGPCDSVGRRPKRHRVTVREEVRRCEPRPRTFTQSADTVCGPWETGG